MTRVWIWRRLTHNVGWKLASLSLSILLWFAVVGEPEVVTIQSVPVLYRNLPATLLLVSDVPSEVRAELRGPSGRLTRDTLSEVFAAINLAGVRGPGVQPFTLSQTDFSLPQGVSFQRAVPSQINLHFERSGSKAVPVEIKLTGALPAGYRLAAKTVQPATLTVSGPETSVGGIQFAQTDPVDLSGITQTGSVKVNAFVDDRRVQFQSQPEVTVWLTIEKTEDVR